MSALLPRTAEVALDTLTAAPPPNEDPIMPTAALATRPAPADTGDPMLDALLTLSADAPWSGTAAELLDALAGSVPAEDLPGSAQALSALLRRFEYELADAALVATFRKAAGGRRLVCLARRSAGDEPPPAAADEQRRAAGPAALVKARAERPVRLARAGEPAFWDRSRPVEPAAPAGRESNFACSIYITGHHQQVGQMLADHSALGTVFSYPFLKLAFRAPNTLDIAYLVGGRQEGPHRASVTFFVDDIGRGRLTRVTVHADTELVSNVMLAVLSALKTRIETGRAMPWPCTALKDVVLGRA